jgi:hypothetical protein
LIVENACDFHGINLKKEQKGQEIFEDSQEINVGKIYNLPSSLM